MTRRYVPIILDRPFIVVSALSDADAKKRIQIYNDLNNGIAKPVHEVLSLQVVETHEMSKVWATMKEVKDILRGPLPWLLHELSKNREWR